MGRLAAHFRNTFVTGALSAIPIVIVLYAVWWIVEHAKPIVAPLGLNWALGGLLIAVGSIYLIGLIVSSIVGQVMLSWMNKLLLKVPGLNLIYRAWRDILVAPPNKASIFHKPILVPVEIDQWQLGFTNGEVLPDSDGFICVLLPHIPSPLSGRLVLVKQDRCRQVTVTTEEAMKFHLSTGIYVPEGVKGLAARSPEARG